MATFKQLAYPANIEVVAGNPFTVTFTATSGVTTFASPVATMTTSGGDAYTTDPGVPTASAASAVLTCAWSAADTAALNTSTLPKTYKYSVRATADGAGPIEWFGGVIVVHPVGATGAATSSSVSAAITTGGVAVSATINVGAQGPAGADGAQGATGATGAAGADGDWSTAQTIRTVAGTTDTPTTSDAGKLVKFTSPSAVAVTIDGSLNLTDGQRIDFMQDGTGQLTFTGSGATVKATPGSKTRAQYSGCTLICDSTDVYWLVGDLSA